MDIDGHVSVRLPDDRTIAVTPGPRSGTPLRQLPERVLRMDLEGQVLAGSPDGLPLGIQLVLAIYRARPRVRAIAIGSPWTATAFGSVRRDVLPLTHSWAEYAHEGAAWLDGRAVDPDATTAEALERAIGPRGYVHVPGVAVIALGDSPLDVLRRLDAFEYLARLTAMATSLSLSPQVVTREQAAGIPAQRPVEPRPSRDYRRYYRSLDREPAPSLLDRWAAEDAEARVRRDIAVACRVLAAAGDLVAFFEHVSHRIPGRDDRFAMSPATDFARMEPDDIGILATEGDCDLIRGPLPPAPFRWYHRDLLARRPDIDAIVHTHELAGRAFLLAGADAPPIHASAVPGMLGGFPPVYPEVSLLFSEEHRTGALDTLGDGPWTHAFAHGTDFVAGDLPTATIRAISWDRHLRFTVLARTLGSPQLLDGHAIAALQARGASAEQRWWDLIDGLEA